MRDERGLMGHKGVKCALAALTCGVLALPSALYAQSSDIETSPSGEEAMPFTPLKEVERVKAEGCGRDQFDAFLYWFSSTTTQGGWLEQVVFTNYLVRIADLDDPSIETGWINRMDYLGQYRITGYDLRLSQTRPAAAVSDDYRRITVTQTDKDHYRVDWAGGPGFGGVPKEQQFSDRGAYVFQYLGDCWYLTQDWRRAPSSHQTPAPRS